MNPVIQTKSRFNDKEICLSCETTKNKTKKKTKKAKQIKKNKNKKNSTLLVLWPLTNTITSILGNPSFLFTCNTKNLSENKKMITENVLK